MIGILAGQFSSSIESIDEFADVDATQNATSTLAIDTTNTYYVGGIGIGDIGS